MTQYIYKIYIKILYRYRTLSPGNAKTENQDDGYETSAGDVLTPNSHSSSTHSVTPQHQLHHSGGHGHGPQQNKHEEQILSQCSSQSQAVASSTNNQGSHPPHLPIKHSIQPHGVILPSAPYSFMSEEMRIHSPDVSVIANASSYAPLPPSVTESISGSGSVSGSTSVTPSVSAPIVVTCSDIAKQRDIYQDQLMIQNQQQLVNNEALVRSFDSGSKQSLDGENSNCGGATIKPGGARTGAADGPAVSPRPLPKRRGRKKKSLYSDNLDTTVSPNG